MIAAVAALAAAGVGSVVALSGGDDPESPVAPPTTAAPGATPTTVQPPWQAALALAEDPPGPHDLARAIVLAEDAVREPATPEADLAGWGRAQQLAYRQLARHPEWDDAVADAIGPTYTSVAIGNAGTFRELWALIEPRDELPDWRIVEPPPPDELLAHYRAAEAEFGVPWPYLASIHLVESRMGRIRGASTAGAQGPMQFLPSTWEAYGEGDIEDPGDAIRAAARYLVDHGAPADMPRALFAYNHSDHYVSAVETYARIMQDNERAYDGYYHWEVYYRLASGDVVLPVGWTRAEGMPGE